MSYSGDFTPVDVSAVNAYDLTAPQVNYNPLDAGAGSSFDFNPDNIIKLLNAGVNVYGNIEAIKHGGYANYSPPATVQGPAPANDYGAPAPYGGGGDPADPTPAQAIGFDWSQLSNFSTPYPYVIGVVGTVALIALVRSMRR
jgi:hypothetical protein